MKKDVKEAVDELVKSMYKAYKKMKKKDPIKDVLDGNTIAEADPDNLPAPKTGTINKFEKSEDFVNNMVDGFKKLSKAYLDKKDKLEKARVDEGLSAKQKKKARASRSEDFVPHKKEKFTQDGARQMPKPDSSALKDKLKDKAKKPSKEDLEYPMAASEKNK